MNVKVQTSYGDEGRITIEPPDLDGDVSLDCGSWGTYYTVPSIRRIIVALQKAIVPRQTRREKNA